MSQKVGRFTISKTTNRNSITQLSCSKPIKSRFRVKRIYSPSNNESVSCYVYYKSDWLSVNCICENKDKTNINDMIQNCTTPKFISNSQLKVSFNITNDQSTQASISKINMIYKRDNFKIECVNSILIQNNIILNCLYVIPN